MIDWDSIVQNITASLSLLLLYIAIFWLAKWVANRLTPYNINHEISEKDNKAVAVAFAGYLLAITIIFAGSLLGPTKGLIQDLTSVASYSVIGIILLNISSVINDKLILPKFNNTKELVEDQNAGTGAVLAGSYIASGLIVAGSIHGEGGGLETALVFFVLGQLALIIFAKIYNKITSFDIHEEIEQDNVAVGVAMGGAFIALGIILMNGSSGNFISWQYNLSYFLVSSLVAFTLLPIFRFFMDKILMPHYDVDHEIHHDRNLGAGILDGIVLISLATILFFVA